MLGASGTSDRIAEAPVGECIRPVKNRLSDDTKAIVAANLAGTVALPRANFYWTQQLPPSQKAARSSRLSTLPALESGKGSVLTLMERGHL